MKTELRAAASCETWAIQVHYLALAIERSDIAAPARKNKLPSVSGAIAVLPVHGMITQRGSIWDDVFGGTSTERLAAAFTRAINDDRVQAVVLDVDSPGGTVHGVQEAGEVIRQGASRKPVVAVANSLAASAAYWLASQVGPNNLMATPSADVGSIGVYRILEDSSALMDRIGIKQELISIPPEKVEDAGVGPLTDAARAHHLEQVQISYDAFVSAVASGRGVAQSKVRGSFGKGRVFKAQQAMEMGMIDRIATLGEVLGELSRSGKAEITAGASASIKADLCHSWESCECEPIVMNHDGETYRRRAKLLDV